MRTRGVFFDLYGTLMVYADMNAAWAAWRGDLWNTLSPCGLTLSRDAFDALCEGFFESPAPAETGDALTVYERRLQRMCRTAGLEPGPAALRRLAEVSIAGWQRHIPLDPDAPRVLRALKARGLALALVTNFDHPPHVLALLAAHRLRRLFTSVVISGSAGLRKPDPRIFDAVLARTGVAAGDALFVGDSREDVEGARAAGLSPVLVRRPGHAAPAGLTGLVTTVGALPELLALVA